MRLTGIITMLRKTRATWPWPDRPGASAPPPQPQFRARHSRLAGHRKTGERRRH
jgi:hypothetical protein